MKLSFGMRRPVYIFLSLRVISDAIGLMTAGSDSIETCLFHDSGQGRQGIKAPWNTEPLYFSYRVVGQMQAQNVQGQNGDELRRESANSFQYFKLTGLIWTYMGMVLCVRIVRIFQYQKPKLALD